MGYLIKYLIHIPHQCQHYQSHVKFRDYHSFEEQKRRHSVLDIIYFLKVNLSPVEQSTVVSLRTQLSVRDSCYLKVADYVL